MLFRLLGLIFILLGLAMLGIDLLADDGRGMLSIGQWWHALHKDSLLLLQPALERHVSPFLWDPVLLTILQWPLSLVTIGFGFLLRLVFRKRREASHFRR